MTGDNRLEFRDLYEDDGDKDLRPAIEALARATVSASNSIERQNGGKKKQTVLYPDGEEVVIEISDDDDDIQFISQYRAELQPKFEPQVYEDEIRLLSSSVTPRGLSKVNGRMHAHSPSLLSNRPAPFAGNPNPFGDGVFELSDDDEPNPIYSIAGPSTPSTSGPVGPYYDDQGKRPAVKSEAGEYKPQNLLDIDFAHLSQGQVSSTGPSTSSKNSAIIDNQRKRPYHISIGSSYDPFGEYVNLSASVITPPKRAKIEEPVVGAYARAKNEPHVPGAWPHKQELVDPYAGYDLPLQLNPYYNPLGQAVPGAIPNFGPPIPVVQNALENGGAPVPVEHWLGKSGFHLNYDEAGPLRSIDRGGPDHQQQLSIVLFNPFLSSGCFNRDGLTHIIDGLVSG
jgi:hypothetical protein